MTRFARAKGSKASNEKLPETATSWVEMKQALLNKTKEAQENAEREKALEARNKNYQAFLEEKQLEESKKTTWSNFSEYKTQLEAEKIKQKINKPNAKLKTKRKLSKSEDEKNINHFNKRKKSLGNEQDKGVDQDLDSYQEDLNESVNENSHDLNKEFLSLKAKIDKVLDSQDGDQINANDSDSDAPPEETSNKKEPAEVINKKSKIHKKKITLSINKEGTTVKVKTKKSKKYELNKISDVKNTVNEKKKKPELDLSEQQKRKILKKQDRFKKQVEKKMLKKEIKLQGSGKNEALIEDENKNMKRNSKNNIDNSSSAEIKVEKMKKQKGKKLQKNLEKQQNAVTKKHDLNAADLEKIKKKKEKKARQIDKKKMFKKTLAQESQSVFAKDVQEQTTYPSTEDQLKTEDNTSFKSSNKTSNKFSEVNKSNLKNNKFNNFKHDKTKTKLRDKDHKRKKPQNNIMFINGKTVEIDYVDGFPVKKEDADRLKSLRKEMISKGLPRSEINAALKLERRRAEKAFAREKKKVCFNCRKSGHNLSECPELDKEQIAQSAGTGICFKCGSTEHTHYECKVVKGLEYKFANCFICNEQGHIARQCPDNQRGLYPKGGACKVCGDVTHLKKDCPKYQAQQVQLQNNLNIDTMDARNPEALDSKLDANTNLQTNKRPNKVIKF